MMNKNYKYFYNKLYKIKDRCRKQNKDHKWYFDKGIICLLTVDDLIYLWNRDEAGKMKSPSIDRINSKGNYELSNCRFIEMSLNSYNANIIIDKFTSIKCPTERLRQRRLTKNKCVSCNNKLFSKRFCKKHTIEARNYHREYYHLKRKLDK